METYLAHPTLSGDIGMQPLASVYDVDGFRGRQEQEMIQALRKQAICHWLRELPVLDENERQGTMWTDYQSCEDGSIEGQEMHRGWGSQDLDGCDLPELTEETPVASSEKKSMPAENEECPVRGLASMKGPEMLLERRLSEATAFREPNRSVELNEQFSKEQNIGDVTEQQTPEARKDPLQSVEEDASAHSTECLSVNQAQAVSDEGDWSAMSDCLDASVRKEDTAYSGSADGAQKEGLERRFHVKYKVTGPVISPPQLQSIEPRTSTVPRPFTPADLKSNAKAPSSEEASDEEWWSPGVFFKGLVGMVCNVGLMVEADGESEQSYGEHEAETSATHERILRRLSYRKTQSSGRRPELRVPSLTRLRMRMRREKRHQDAKSHEVCCELQHPLDMRLMEPTQSQIPHPLSPPAEIRATEYQPPHSIADLSDFESFLGSVQWTAVQDAAAEYARVGHCQSWLLENLLCFLGGKPRLS